MPYRASPSFAVRMHDAAKRSIAPWVALAALAWIGVMAYLSMISYLHGIPLSFPVLLLIVVLVIAALLGYFHIPTEERAAQPPTDENGRT